MFSIITHSTSDRKRKLLVAGPKTDSSAGEPSSTSPSAPLLLNLRCRPTASPAKTGSAESACCLTETGFSAASCTWT